MEKFKLYIDNILLVSKLTNVKSKKLIIFFTVCLSQLVVFTDVAIIVVFASLLANQVTNISLVNDFLELILEQKYIIFLIIFVRYFCHYQQNILLKKLEADVHKNLKFYFLNQVFSKKNYSSGDAFFYINTLSSHVSFFYNNFANLLNSILQVIAYSVYLLISDLTIVSIFGAGILLLFYPTIKLLKIARRNLDKVYKKDYETNQDLEKIIQDIVEFSTKLSASVPVVFLENYDMELGRLITSGVDVWLNTPLRPNEASGTSGMKAALNAVPNLSIIDGWWAEGCIHGKNGWAIGSVDSINDQDDADSLYTILESDVIPTFYKNQARWLEIMRSSIKGGVNFTGSRMIKEYNSKFYSFKKTIH
mgnify:CR=1 FL=1